MEEHAVHLHDDEEVEGGWQLMRTSTVDAGMTPPHVPRRLNSSRSNSSSRISVQKLKNKKKKKHAFWTFSRVREVVEGSYRRGRERVTAVWERAKERVKRAAAAVKVAGKGEHRRRRGGKEEEHRKAEEEEEEENRKRVQQRVFECKEEEEGQEGRAGEEAAEEGGLEETAELPRAAEEGEGGGEAEQDGGGGDVGCSSLRSLVLEVPVTWTTEMQAHAGDVNDMVFSQMGTCLATAGDDGVVRVWDAHDGHLLHALPGGSEPLLSVDMDVAEEWAIAGSSDNSVRLWSIAGGGRRGAEETLLGHTGNVYAVKFLDSAKLHLITGAADRTIRVWDARRMVCKETLRAGSTCNGIDVATEPDTAGLPHAAPVSAHHDGSVRVWDLRKSNKAANVIKAFQDSQVTSVAYGKGGYTVLANSRGNILKVLDLRTNEVICTMHDRHYSVELQQSRACWSPSNAYVAAGSGMGMGGPHYHVMIWDSTTGDVRASLPGHTSPVTTTAWAHTPALTSSASSDGGGGTRRLASADKSGRVLLWSSCVEGGRPTRASSSSSSSLSSSAPHSRQASLRPTTTREEEALVPPHHSFSSPALE